MASLRVQVWARRLVATLAFLAASVAYVYLTVPDVRPLRSEPPETTAFMELRARQAEANGERPRHVQEWRGYDRISSSLKRAVLVAEDSAFWDHEGIDLEQIRESIEINLEQRAVARGASTITQQLAKNLYLSPSRNPYRKLKELFIARRLEAELSKRRILELYLNVIEWGDGIYGAEAAARTYFGKPASALTAEEAALLAGAIINPRVLNPRNPSRRLRARQRLILRRMGGVTPPGDAVPALQEPAPAPGVPAILPGRALPPESRPIPPSLPDGHR
jgi:monofunctional biosynthetic peptidoglycan transglycosylase